MANNSKIEWTDRTWNPVRGCSMAKGSETGGCLNCYAARMAARNLPELKSPTTGESFARVLPSGPRWTGKVELIESALTAPLHWRKPQRVFVNSMSDLFHEALSTEPIDDIFGIMARCPQHTFQILTKRPEGMLAYLTHEDVIQRIAETVEAANWEQGHDAEIDWRDCDLEHWPLPNVWLGVSCENQATADVRIPLLLQTPASKRFVSYEPALGPVDFYAPCTASSGEGLHGRNHIEAFADGHEICGLCGDEGRGDEADLDSWLGHGLDWIIVGGESGPGARPFDIEWARNTIQQCREAGVACFVKQIGANPFDSSGLVLLAPKDRKGGDMSEWSEDLRVREFPKSEVTA